MTGRVGAVDPIGEYRDRVSTRRQRCPVSCTLDPVRSTRHHDPLAGDMLAIRRRGPSTLTVTRSAVGRARNDVAPRAHNTYGTRSPRSFSACG